MTIESEIAGLTAATTDLLAAVNVRKATLDEKVLNATTQVTLAAEQATLAATQAGIAATKAGDSAASATASQASANNAASAVVSQLTSIKTQTETARDQALAGLGAADNSQALADLLGAISYVTDMALLVARKVSGGSIELQAGSASMPALRSLADLDTGLLWPTDNTLAVATGGVERLRVTADGRIGLGTNAPSGLLDVSDNKIRVRTAQTIASATASGNQGEIAWDANYVYVCTATNTWRRSALTTW
jgi:hypothetical protein